MLTPNDFSDIWNPRSWTSMIHIRILPRGPNTANENQFGVGSIVVQTFGKRWDLPKFVDVLSVNLGFSRLLH